MQLKNLLAGLFILISLSILAQQNTLSRKNKNTVPQADSVKLSIGYLKKHLQQNDVWQSENPEIMRLVKGLVDFAENEHIDSILVRLDRFQEQKDARYINRQPKYVSDSLLVPGYLPYPNILEKLKQLNRAIWNGVDMNAIPLPEELQIGRASCRESV